MLIGYARVSTEDQHLDLQHDALREVGFEKTFEDKKSGAKTDRPGLASALDYARAGDQLVVWCLDRLGRSLPDLIALVRERTRAGLEAARARGRMGGRKHRLSPDKRRHAVELYRAKDTTVREICTLMGISKPTLYAYVAEANAVSAAEQARRAA